MSLSVSQTTPNRLQTKNTQLKIQEQQNASTKQNEEEEKNISKREDLCLAFFAPHSLAFYINIYFLFIISISYGLSSFLIRCSFASADGVLPFI